MPLNSKTISLAVLGLVMLVWTYQQRNLFFQAGAVSYSGDVASYEGSAEEYFNRWQQTHWNSPEEGFRLFRLLLPFPEANKPGYSYQIFLTKLLVAQIAPDFVPGALRILQWALYLGSVGLGYGLLRKWEVGSWVALCFSVIPLFSFDVLLNAQIGYPGLAGLFWFLWVLLLFDRTSTLGLVLLGGVTFYAVASTPHLLPVVLAFCLYQGALVFYDPHRNRPTYRLNLAQLYRLFAFLPGAFGVWLLSELTYQLRSEFDGFSVPLLQNLFGQAHSAGKFGGELPYSPEYLVAYAQYAFGSGFWMLFVLAGAWVLWPGNLSSRLRLWTGGEGLATWVCLVSWALIVLLKLPCIGRLYTPTLFLMVLLAALGCSRLGKLGSWGRRGLPQGMALLCLGAVLLHFYFPPPLNHEADGLAQFGADLVETRQFSGFSPSELRQVLLGKKLVIQGWHHFSNTWLHDCELLFVLAEYSKEAHPSVLMHVHLPNNDFGTCFENDYAYHGLCRDWRIVFGSFTYFEQFPPLEKFVIDADPFLAWLEQKPDRTFGTCPK